MEKILYFFGDSFTASSITDYEWITNRNLIDKNKIKLLDFLISYQLYKKNNSIFNLSQKIKKENSWSNRLAKKLNLNYINLSMFATCWQGVMNQIMYCIAANNNKNKEIIFIIGCPINERILIDKQTKEISNQIDFRNFYDMEKTKTNDFLLNNYSFHLNNKFNFLYEKKYIEILETMFSKKIFSIYNLQTIIAIISLVKEKKFFFMPTWHETVYEHIKEISNEKEILENFIYKHIPEEQLKFKSPFILKDMKTSIYSQHPSFESQELIAEHYYNFLKNKI